MEKQDKHVASPDEKKAVHENQDSSEMKSRLYDILGLSDNDEEDFDDDDDDDDDEDDDDAAAADADDDLF